MNPRNFFAEVKRRNVYKIAAAYAIVAWVLIQAASILFPTFEAPAWVMKVFVGTVILGFPIALILAWAFELTPQGIKFADEAAPFSSPPHKRRRQLIAVMGVLVLVGIGLLSFRFVRPKAPLTATEVVSAPVGGRTLIPDKSIAVLPFENLSRDPDNAFFTDGVQDEILTDLAKIADLKVISRTSVMQYTSGAPRNLRKIGEELGVAHLLEGSVQRAEGKVRVNAQLIDAQTDAHLWANTYDRNLADVFAIQSEIAEAIAEQLQARLLPSEKAAIAKPPTTDLRANNLYMRARQLDDLSNDPEAKENLLEAIRLLDEAVNRDPNFVLAYCLMCETHLDLYWLGFDHTEARRELAHAALERAERIQPDSGDVHTQKGIYAYHGFRDYEKAREELEFAKRLCLMGPGFICS